MEYEICYLIGETKEINLDEIRKEVEKAIEKNEGKLIEGEFVRKRRLAYQIKNEARGTYVAKRFTLPGKDERDEKNNELNLVDKISKEVKFNPNIIRFIIVKSDELLSFDELEIADKDSKEARKGGKRDNFSKTARTEERQVKKEKFASVKKEEKEVAAKEEVKEILAEEKKPDSAKDMDEAKSAAAKTKADKEKKKVEKKDDKPAKDESGDEISEDNIDAKLDEILNI